MPELPEVETISRQLQAKIVGKKLKGKKIIKVRRRAKLLIIDFIDKTSLVFHLKLTGQLIYNSRPSRFTRQVFYFNGGSNLVFNDMRKFGWFKFIKRTEDLEKKFGPEALKISFKDFQSRLTKRPKSKIKLLLMDQKFIAGIGNIYSDEILFCSGVRPARLAASLTEKEIKAVFDNIAKVLQAAIKARGSSEQSYLDALGKKGDYVKYHQVYRRTGLPCKKCRAPIKRIKLAGRSAHYCPKCQK